MEGGGCDCAVCYNVCISFKAQKVLNVVCWLCVAPEAKWGPYLLGSDAGNVGRRKGKKEEGRNTSK